MAGGGHVRVNRLKPRAPMYAYTEHAQFVNVSYSSAVYTFMRDSGCNLKFFITSRVPIHKSIRPTDEVIMMNNDETYDEIMMKLG